MYGYAGTIAKINLTTGEISDYPLKEEDRILYLGGKSLAAKIIYDSLKEKTEAFSEENLIVITTSPLTGTGSPSSSRFNVSAISPLTELLASSNCGGTFGLKLKSAGYDGLVISGKSKEKVYIEISENRIEIKDASHLWGKTTGQTQDMLGNRSVGKFVIGPAGENMVRYAAVISDERAAGRCGVGAVFGYKNLKAITAAGTKRTEIHDDKKFKAHNQRWIGSLKKHIMTGRQIPELGTASFVNPMNKHNLLATKNYKSGSYDNHEKICGETLRNDYLVKNKGCVTCPIQCGRVVKVSGKEVKGPELETITLLGSNLLNGSLENIIELNYLCDEYGIDTMSFGSSIGLAMELNEKGMWNNGINFGDSTKLVQLVKMTAYREGIGNELAEGTRRMSEKFGGRDFAINVKGLELAAYEPRGAQGMGLGYATSNRGGCHLNGGYMVVLEGLVLNTNSKTTKGKAAFTIFFQDLMEAISAGGSCLFTSISVVPDFLIKNPENLIVKLINKMLPLFGGIVGFMHNHSRLLGFNLKNIVAYPYSIKLVTGFDMNLGKFIQAGERSYNLERIINIRQGLTGRDDTLPKRLTEEFQLSYDPNSKVKLNEMLKKYYKIRGWDDKGIPTIDRMNKLNIH
ncbi:MAG TPA: aldehyde ferredoxin oxidoreductase family protein [Sedimentibacter sp.]|nr:aldehyde ferredoxin oxidoreductase family protein [Sedimentibacter sp.]